MKTIIGVVFLVLGIIVSMTLISKGEIYLDSALGISTSESVSSSSSEEETEMIKVTLSGCVSKKGTYKVSNGSYLYDALELAGGVSENADTSCFDNYLVINEDIAIYIAPTTSYSKISLNSADEDELKELDGIGKTLASRIVEYRAENGDFTYLEEILLVEGVGKSVFSKNKDKICL